MKLIELYNVERLHDKFNSRTDLPVKTAYKVVRFFETVEKEASFYRDELIKILNEYAERDEEGKVVVSEDGQNIKIKEELLTECEDKLKELADMEVDKPSVTFNLEELPDGWSAQELELLMPFIEE